MDLQKQSTKQSLSDAIRRASRVLCRAQREDGSWDERSDVGPASTANVLVALSYAGILTAEDRDEGGRWLRWQQLTDGSFRPHPFAKEGSLSVTAQCWAALHLASKDGPRGREAAEAAARAERYVASHGGVDRVVEDMRYGDVAAIFLALAGLLPPSRLPCPPLAWCLVDGLVDRMSERFHFGIIMGALQLSLIAKRLRGDFGADGSKRSWLERKACRRAVQLMTTFQNPDGSWNSNTVQTAIAVPALLAAGLDPEDDRVRRACRWLESRRVIDDHGIWFDVFSSDVWSTAFGARALMLAGTPPGDPRIVRALEWLLERQLRVPQPKVNNRRPGALRTGGWPFQTGNDTMADCDDAGIVLSVFGLALEVSRDAQHPNEERLPEELKARIESSVRYARAWLRDMQNPDGGWPAFVWNVPGRRPVRTLFTAPPDLPPNDLLGALRTFLRPPPELGDPSTEDLTARVLHGLGSHGADATDPEVDAALRFLRAHQSDFGAWWGRWVCNYIASTAYVLSALSKVREDFGEAYVTRAVSWIVSCQNPDGGFGESTESYRDVTKAGRGPSTVPLTALVVHALVEIGRGDLPVVERAVDYLLRKQRPDGTWPNDDYLATNIPPDGFYVYRGATMHMPLEALARYARRHEQAAIVPAEQHGRFSHAMLSSMRQLTDPAADEVVEAIYARGAVEEVTSLLQSILENDDPIPPGLPPEARDFFDRTAKLPEWADPAQIKRAQAIFAEFGVYITFGLFCSSLPQAYASAHGAQVLVETGAMLDRVRQRIFETAQFLFDVLDVGGLEPDGRGIRSAQRVRLMHAAVRRLIHHELGDRFDTITLGQPINQEDLAGTLMTFSVVTYEAAQRLGVFLTRNDGEAWVHHWRVIGHLLGIREELLPNDLAEAEHLMEAIRQRQWATSTTGRRLAAALVDMMQELFTRDAPLLDGLTPTLIRHLAGDECGDILGLDGKDWTLLLVRALEVATDVVDVDDRETWLEEQLGAIVLRTMRWITEVERGHKRASFRLPQSLRETVLRGT